MSIVKPLILGCLVCFLSACSSDTLETTSADLEQNVMLLPLDEPFYVDEDLIRQLESLGYLGGHDTETDSSGVVVYSEEQAWNGYNIVTSGHGPEVDLISMDGQILHTWHAPRNAVFPTVSQPGIADRSRSFRRAYALPNGDLIGVYNGTGMVRLTWQSDVLWRQEAMCHHDLTFASDDTLFTFVQRKRFFEDFNPDEPVYDEFIVKIDAVTGKILDRFSLLEAFYNSNYASMLKKAPSAGDIFHANTIVYIDSEVASRLPVYHTGSLLVCLRNMDTIAIVNPDTRKVTWALTGLWSFQHEPSILENGNILLFDNAGHFQKSKVIEFNPLTQDIVWGYYDSPETPFFTSTSGACYRFPNGNTLIVESNRGRVFEVLQDGTYVWEYLNVHRWGGDNHLIATVFDVQRVGFDYFIPELTAF